MEERSQEDIVDFDASFYEIRRIVCNPAADEGLRHKCLDVFFHKTGIEPTELGGDWNEVTTDNSYLDTPKWAVRDDNQLSSVLARVARIPIVYLRGLAAGNRNTPVDDVIALAGHPDPWVRYHTLDRIDLGAMLAELLADDGELQAKTFTRNANVTGTALERIRRRTKDHLGLIAIARHGNTLPETHQILARSELPGVRKAVAETIRDRHILEELAQDTNPRVKTAARKSLRSMS